MDSERLVAIIEASAPEGLTLEFKSKLPGRTDRDRAELLKDVSAMANAAGGTILFGIEEKAGIASSFSGFNGADPDSEIRRLAQIIESGIEPRLSGVNFEYVATPKGDVLVLQIPESFDSPHRYLFNGHSKFVMRNGTHTSELSFDQLRAAFDRSSSRLTSLREMWKDDISLSNLWKPILEGPVCVVRLTPMIAADRKQILDPKSAHAHWDKLIFSDWGGGSSQFNYAGLAVFSGRGHDALGGFVQVHRNGALTAYRTARMTVTDRKVIPPTNVGNFIQEAAGKLIRFTLLAGLRGSAVLQVGLARLSGFEFGIYDGHGFDLQNASDMNEIQMPEIWLDDLESVPENLDHLLRPGFDLLWQSYGRSECPLFDLNGHWSPQLRG